MTRFSMCVLIGLLTGCAMSPQHPASSGGDAASAAARSAPARPNQSAASDVHAPLEAMAHSKHKANSKTPKGGVTGRQPGDFDYYLLTLSWSPTWAASHCAADDSREQCKVAYGFVVHGLWPQYDDGSWPQDCAASTKLTTEQTAEAAEAMPDTDLMQHEWDKHGTCSGLTPAEYFTTIADTFGSIEIPDALQAPSTSQAFDPHQLVNTFRQANPQFPEGSVLVSCVGKTQGTSKLAEIRICLDHDLAATECTGSVATNVCRADSIVVPPVGGEGAPTAAMRANKPASVLNQTFGGTYRKAVKLSIPTGSSKQYALVELMDSLPSDDEMLGYSPTMSSVKNAPTKRLDDENVNVSMDAYLVAFGHEADNDFHCVLSNTKNVTDPNARFMNVEISGLPATSAATFAKLKEARKEFLTTVQDKTIKTSGYTKIQPGISVHVTGALFFDGEHANRPPGPNYAKPEKVWELHPVTSMALQP